MSKHFSFHRSLYLPEAIQAAAEAYAGHARIAIVPDGDRFEVEVAVDADDDLDLIAGSFANHVLYESILRTRQAEVA